MDNPEEDDSTVPSGPYGPKRWPTLVRSSTYSLADAAEAPPP